MGNSRIENKQKTKKKGKVDEIKQILYSFNVHSAVG